MGPPSLRRLLCVATLAGCLTLVAAAPAGATTETASSGTVAATFSYTKVDDFRWKDLRLTVDRAGQQAFAGVPHAPGCKAPYCAPGDGGTGSGALHVVDLDGDGEPEVLVDLYTGGAHCCTVTELLRWTGSAYATQTRDWADPGYTLDTTGGGTPTFVTADPRFDYAFTAYAFSALPVRLLSFRAGMWHDVTRAHPESLRADARRWAREYHAHRNGHYALGLLAAWVADEYRLGRRHSADRFLAHELRAGRLKGVSLWPRRRAYVRVLHRRLRAWGYAKS